MNPNEHISDHDILSIVQANPETDVARHVETHVSHCQRCQSRMVDIAADPQWRNEFSDSVTSLGIDSSIDTTHFRDFTSDPPPQDNAWDLHAIEGMLGDTLQPPIHPEMLGRLGRYDVAKIIGFGGMGVVLRGFDRELHRPVAIKMILPRLAQNGTAKQRFAREARAAAAVIHPNVVSIHDISETDSVPWFVMPLIVGPSLKEVVSSRGPLPTKEVVRIGVQLASGLAAAHTQGLVHRDIKPANVLVDNQVNRIVITDFGLARRETEETMTQTGMIAGTLNYMSPEQSRGADIDCRSDLFSVGGLLYFLATGETPFQADTPMGVIHRIGHQNHPRVRSINPDVTPQLEQLIDCLLEKAPDHRLQSAGELETYLAEYLAHLNQPTKVSLPRLSSRRTWRMVPTAMKTLAAAACLVAFAVLVWTAAIKLGRNVQSEPVVATRVMSWPEIQQKFGIEEDGVFRQELRTLAGEFERADEFDRPIRFRQQDPFVQELNQLSSAIGASADPMATPRTNRTNTFPTSGDQK